MFSNAERCIYGRNHILEKVCQYRFPTILNIETNPPAEFQDAIRDEFPRYETRKEQQPPKFVGQPPKPEPQAPVTNHCFTSVDGVWRVNLTKDFIALTTSRYTRWEEFARLLDKVLYQFIQVYKPACFDRVGLRYINAFSRNALGLENVPWKDLIEEKYLGFLSEETLAEQAFSRCTQDVDVAIDRSCRLKLHTGPGLIRRATEPDNKEIKFVLDTDVSMGGTVPVNLAAGAMSTLHVHAYSVFRAAITDTLHDAMEPEEG